MVAWFGGFVVLWFCGCVCLLTLFCASYASVSNKTSCAYMVELRSMKQTKNTHI